MGSALSLWKACGPVALPLLLLSLAVFTVVFERGWFWGRWWWRERRPRAELLQQLEACPSPQARAALLCRQQRLMAWGEPLLQATQKRFHDYVVAGQGTAKEALDGLVQDWTEVFQDEGKL